MINIRPATKAEELYVHHQSQQISMQTGYIGKLRGDADKDSTEFDTFSWRLRTDEFWADLEDVLSELRSNALPHNDSIDVLRIDTEIYTYFCLLVKQSITIFCYTKVQFDSHFTNAEKGIRFIDSHYNELFHINDGDNVVITNCSGVQHIYVCRFIDYYHTEVGNNLFHICEFAETMERNKCVVYPAKTSSQN